MINSVIIVVLEGKKMRCHLVDSVIRIKNRKVGLVKLSRTKEVIQLIKLLKKNKLIDYKVKEVDKFYIYIELISNNIKKTKKLSTRQFIGWKGLRELDKEIIMRTNNGLMSLKEGITHKTGGIIVMTIN